MAEDDLTHNPECGFWFYNYAWVCTCGLTVARPEYSNLEPWTESHFKEWTDAVNAHLNKHDILTTGTKN